MFAIMLLFILPAIHALTCYENDNEGNSFLVTNSSWNYCALIPDGAGGKQFGIGPLIDNTMAYDSTFAQSGALYKILTLCMYEKYDFSKISPVFGSKPEFLFRCVCNYDKCNSRTTFSDYLKNVREENS